MKIYTFEGKSNISGERIRQARVIQKMTQSDLAARIQTKGVTMERDSISRIEHGIRFVADYELKIFAEALGVTVEWLLDE
ncbi:MAG: helix-turn-helix transcriptional regulator [Eubacterium sp.]|nr:helix-turn-helix transcriptional regulator [Eubacterium sp.]